MVKTLYLASPRQAEGNPNQSNGEILGFFWHFSSSNFLVKCSKKKYYFSDKGTMGIFVCCTESLQPTNILIGALSHCNISFLSHWVTATKDTLICCTDSLWQSKLLFVPLNPYNKGNFSLSLYVTQVNWVPYQPAASWLGFSWAEKMWYFQCTRGSSGPQTRAPCR